MATTTLTTPEVGATSYKPLRLSLYWDEDTDVYEVSIAVKADTGKVVTFGYKGAEAQTLISGLNTADLSVKSLWVRILERLDTDGHVVGTVT